MGNDPNLTRLMTNMFQSGWNHQLAFVGPKHCQDHPQKDHRINQESGPPHHNSWSHTLRSYTQVNIGNGRLWRSTYLQMRYLQPGILVYHLMANRLFLHIFTVQTEESNSFMHVNEAKSWWGKTCCLTAKTFEMALHGFANLFTIRSTGYCMLRLYPNINNLLVVLFHARKM